MQIDVYSGSLTRLRSEVLIVTCFEDVRPLRGLASEVDWFYSGIISRVLLQNHFSGQFGRTLLIQTEGKLKIEKVILVGLGKSTAYNYTQFESAAELLLHTVSHLNIHECAVEVNPLSIPSLDTLRLAGAFLNGWKSSGQEEIIRLTLVMKEREQAKLLQYKIQNGDILSHD